jgi:uncharacterized oxidoreductase
MTLASTEVVFVTGGGSGIGRGLASAFHGRGAKVIVAGRTLETLEAVVKQHPGMELEVLDVADAGSIAACSARIADRHSNLSTVINNAGVQNLIDFAADAPITPDLISREIDINLKGLIQVSNTFLPLLRQQQSARLVHVGSGLGYVPLAAAPVYSATKAAVHSFSISLRHQLKGTGVKVVEIIPPVVETNLHRGQSRRPPNAMSLDLFVAAAMTGLDRGDDEVAIGLARVLRFAHRVAPGLVLKIVNKTRD